ncbi:MAG: hypothetical protein AAF664_10575 [Planctomycetota bacterium]
MKQFRESKFGREFVSYFKGDLLRDLKSNDEFDEEFVALVEFFQSDEGKPLLDLALRLSKQELFVFGDGLIGKAWGDALKVQREILRDIQTGDSTVDDLQDLDVLMSGVPTIMAGGKVGANDYDFISLMLDRFEPIIRKQIGQVEDLSDVEKEYVLSRLNRSKEGAASDHLVLHLVGNEYPWESMRDRLQTTDLEKLEEQIEKMKAMEFVFSVGRTGNHAVVCFSSNLKHLSDLQNPDPLFKRGTFEPVLKARSRAFTSIGYQSSEYKQLTSWLTILEPAVQVSLATVQKDLATKLGDTEEARSFLADVQNDVDEFINDLQKVYNPPGDSLSFGFLFGKGIASLSYDFRNDSIQASNQVLDVLRHVGEKPAYFSAAGNGEQRESLYSKWASRVWQRSEEMDAIMGNVAPPFVFGPLEELYRITVDEFLPSMGDESAFVIDLSQSQDSWHPALGGFTIPAPALVFEVEDAVAYRGSWRKYYETINELAAPFRPMLPLPPGQDLPPAVESDMEDGIYLQVPMVEMLGANEAFRPGMALNEGWSVFSFFPSQAESLMSESEPSLPSPLSNLNRPLLTASHFDQGQIFDLVINYVEDAKPMILQQLSESQASDPFDEGPGNSFEQTVREMTPEELYEAITVSIDLIRCMRSQTSATYVEGNAIVSQKAVVFEDLP